MDSGLFGFICVFIHDYFHAYIECFGTVLYVSIIKRIHSFIYLNIDYDPIGQKKTCKESLNDMYEVI